MGLSADIGVFPFDEQDIELPGIYGRVEEFGKADRSF